MQLKQTIGRLTQRVVDESLRVQERVGAIRLPEERANPVKLLDQINEVTIGESGVVHGRTPYSKGAALKATP